MGVRAERVLRLLPILGKQDTHYERYCTGRGFILLTRCTSTNETKYNEKRYNQITLHMKGGDDKDD